MPARILCRGINDKFVKWLRYCTTPMQHSLCGTPLTYYNLQILVCTKKSNQFIYFKTQPNNILSALKKPMHLCEVDEL